MLKSSLSTRSVIEALESRIAPATFTVTTTADSGPGSLRQAILDANALEGADTIGFNIEGDQLQIIALTSPLPTITEKITISTLQSWDVQTEFVQIDGKAAGADAIGLWISTPLASESVVAGLQIANFSSSGIRIENSSNVEIAKNHIYGSGQHGLHIIGGSSSRIYGNTIGTSESTPPSTGNKGTGILLENTSYTRITPPRNFDTAAFYPPQETGGNTIRGNGLFGIEIRGGQANSVAINVISGNGAHSTQSDQGGGIGIFDSRSTYIGSSVLYVWVDWLYSYSKVAGNTISNNIGNGILIQGAESSETVIAGNTISGHASGDGVHINGAKGTTFGMTYSQNSPRGVSEYMVGNTISDNGQWGIAVVNGATDTLIRASTLSGNSSGAILFDHAADAVIGTTKVYTSVFGSETSRDGNKIRFGAGKGITVRDSHSIEIADNEYSGTGLSIDLNDDGQTINDEGDTDVGANHSQNYPTLNIAPHQLQATLRTDASGTPFRIQIYKFISSTGQYLPFNTSEITTDSNGLASLLLQNSSISRQDLFFATATNLNTGETSELSPPASLAPLVSISPATITEGDSGTQSLSFTVSLDIPINIPVKVNFRSSDDSAKAGEDYGAVESFLIFEPGEITKTITVSVYGDPIKEYSETFFIDLTSADNGLLLNARARGTIYNDDDLPLISIQDAIIGERQQPNYTISLSKTSPEPVTVRIRSVGGTATEGMDYVTFDKTVTIPPNTLSTTITLDLGVDTVPEDIETIQLQLSEPLRGVLENDTALVSIIDDDTWMIQADPVQVWEGNGLESVAVMKIRLVNSIGAIAHDYPIQADFRTANREAVASSDYTRIQGTLTFQPGEFEKTISIPIIGDNIVEKDENFVIEFTNLLGATVAPTSSAVITILNDDLATLSIASASISEGNTGQKMLVFNVGLSGPMSTQVSVNFATQNGTATEGSDFETISGTLTFAPGETKKTVSVPIYGDRLVEGDEKFLLKLSDVFGATLSSDSAQGTILEDEAIINIESMQFLAAC